MRKIKILSAVLAASILAACGGGSTSEGYGIGAAPTPAIGGNTDIAAIVANVGDSEAAPSFVDGGMIAEHDDVMQARAATAYPAYYTPAHIRAAYGLAPLPASYDNLTPVQAASLGAGQTIYIVDAYHSPNMLSDLNAFSTKFGLPTCTNVPITDATTLPAADSRGRYLYIGNNDQRGKMKPARTNGCDVVTVYTKTGWIVNAPPANNSTWGLEIALDTQWAHAIAPLARIVVIESLNTFANEMIQSVMAANAFGPGTVSMSWTIGEWYLQHTWEQFFNVSGMSYFAAAGDRGTQANWPAASPSVIAVGGTTLKYNGVDATTETGWAKSGGGYSTFFPKPAYQSAIWSPPTVTGKYANTAFANQGERAIPDVAMVADPATGVYTQFTPAGSSTLYYKMGGTSAGSPMWAAITANSNATRALTGKTAIGKFHNALYAGYSNGLKDITTGNNGTQAVVGFDTVTGLGVPKVDYLTIGMSN